MLDTMTKSDAVSTTGSDAGDSPRERLFRLATFLLAAAFLPIALLWRPGRARYLACQWALGLRFPDENLDGLTLATWKAFTEARTIAFWRDRQLIGLTSGYRDAGCQHRLFTAEVQRTGSAQAARMRVLPPAESEHVRGIALDVRPATGARWLEDNGGDHHLHRTYDNEWWHFEYRPATGATKPSRRAHPGVAELRHSV